MTVVNRCQDCNLSRGAHRAPLQNARLRTIASGKVRAQERLLGLRAGEHGRSAHSQFPEGRRRGRGGMETGAEIRGVPRRAQRRHYWQPPRLPLQLDGLLFSCTVTADYAIKLLRPTPTKDAVFLSAKVVESKPDRATIEGTLSAGGKVCATCRGTFVAVTEGYPAYHRW